MNPFIYDCPFQVLKPETLIHPSPLRRRGQDRQVFPYLGSGLLSSQGVRGLCHPDISYFLTTFPFI